jgi:hypothetical protein
MKKEILKNIIKNVFKFILFFILFVAIHLLLNIIPSLSYDNLGSLLIVFKTLVYSLILSLLVIIYIVLIIYNAIKKNGVRVNKFFNYLMITVIFIFTPYIADKLPLYSIEGMRCFNSGGKWHQLSDLRGFSWCDEYYSDGGIICNSSEDCVGKECVMFDEKNLNKIRNDSCKGFFGSSDCMEKVRERYASERGLEIISGKCPKYSSETNCLGGYYTVDNNKIGYSWCME